MRDDDDGKDDDDGEAFTEITMEEVERSRSNLGDRGVSRSMDDIGMTSVGRHHHHHHHQLLSGKSPLGIGKTTPKTKRHKRAVPVPASEVPNPIKTGYLELKKSGSWKRCWVLVNDERLYIYRKPTDSQTLDMLILEDYRVQRVQISSSAKVGNKFAFELYHPRVSETQFQCDTQEEREAWVEAISEGCKMEGASPHRGSSEKLSLLSRLESDPGEQQAQLSDGNKASASSSDNISDGSPIMERKKQYIEDKYERQKEAQDNEMLRLNTILNQRRMSADVKITAVEKKLLQQRKQRKRKKNSTGDSQDEEGAFLEEQLEQLQTRLADIEKESQETNLKQEGRRRAIEAKKDVEFKILEQERKLQKHRKAAQEALQQIVKGISSITPPIGGSRPRFDLISEEAEEQLEERKLSMASSVGISSSDSMGSLCEPKKPISDVFSMHAASTELLVPTSRRQAVHRHPMLDTKNPHSDSSTDSSSSMDSPEVARHDFNLVAELTKTFPLSDVDGGSFNVGSRDKSKSFDSGIADEVDVNSNKTMSVTTNGHLVEERVDDSANGNLNTMTSTGMLIRTDISEDVLRDIEEFEKIARRALEQASWMV